MKVSLPTLKLLLGMFTLLLISACSDDGSSSSSSQSDANKINIYFANGLLILSLYFQVFDKQRRILWKFGGILKLGYNNKDNSKHRIT